MGMLRRLFKMNKDAAIAGQRTAAMAVQTMAIAVQGVVTPAIPHATRAKGIGTKLNPATIVAILQGEPLDPRIGWTGKMADGVPPPTVWTSRSPEHQASASTGLSSLDWCKNSCPCNSRRVNSKIRRQNHLTARTATRTRVRMSSIKVASAAKAPPSAITSSVAGLPAPGLSHRAGAGYVSASKTYKMAALRATARRMTSENCDTYCNRQRPKQMLKVTLNNRKDLRIRFASLKPFSKPETRSVPQ